MKFEVAATILASTLHVELGASIRGVEADGRKKEVAFKRFLNSQDRYEKKTGNNDRRKFNAGMQRMLQRKRGVLQNLVITPTSKDEQTITSQVACDPDVGVLSCGFGQFCDPRPTSTSSDLGGVCLPLPSSSFERTLQEIEPVLLNETAADSNCTDCILEGPGVYCDARSTSYGSLDCDCTEWSTENRTGSIACNLKINTCQESCDNTCYSVDFSYFSDGINTYYQYCFEFTAPYEQSFCYGYANDGTCMIAKDGTMCSSCNTTYELVCENGACGSNTCANFDCDNIDIGVGNACDDTVLPPAFYQCYLEVNDRYPSCSICQDEVLNPEALFSLPGLGEFNCSYIQEYAESGSLNPQQCTYAASLAENICCGSDSPVYICNICGEDNHVVTKTDALVSFPGQPPMSCESVEVLAVQGGIPALQCGIFQGFIQESCGCMHVEEANAVDEGTTGDGDSTPSPDPNPEQVITNESDAQSSRHVSSFFVSLACAVVTFMVKS